MNSKKKQEPKAKQSEVSGGTVTKKHTQIKKSLRIIGILLLVLSIGLISVGGYLFSRPILVPDFPFEEIGRSSFLGIVLLGGGSFLLVISLQLLYGAYVGTISKYLADETAPAVSTGTKAVTKGVREAGGA
ncbi:MAG: tetraspanin family protein [Candidatus Korarchaeota archaeon]|nr:tetraspanin family protein [Candidatus Korarchaeota archaeon]NIU84953.1 hypothetical protein [Candidatus Thorarchaeota archaeon]NIW14645.1 hypothetical protein [Candidatus Thorarchaeota archaeon]NIW52989.1 hypothetical protein [Candidatus Korarchaeota archaeon]